MKRVLLFVCVMGCEDVPQPFELDHARVMAVRIDPPALMPESVGRIEVLITDAAGGPRIADAVTVTAPMGITVTTSDVVAPTEAELAATRSALGLAADADVIVPLQITVESSEGLLTAQKTIAFGSAAMNPPPPAILVDGEPMIERIDATGASSLAVADATAALSYRWFSSVGDLIGYTTSAVRFDDPPGGEGTIGVVVRDQAGGVAWTLAAATVTP